MVSVGEVVGQYNMGFGCTIWRLVDLRSCRDVCGGGVAYFVQKVLPACSRLLPPLLPYSADNSVKVLLKRGVLWEIILKFILRYLIEIDVLTSGNHFFFLSLRCCTVI